MDKETRNLFKTLLVSLRATMWATAASRREFITSAIGPQHEVLRHIVVEGQPDTVAGNVIDALATHNKPLPDGRFPLLALLDEIVPSIGDAKRQQIITKLQKCLTTSMKQSVSTPSIPSVSPHPSKSKRGRLQDCFRLVFSGDQDLRAFCFEYFPDVYRDLKDTDRMPHVIISIIIYCETHGLTENLWQLLIQRNAGCMDHKD